MKLTSDSFANGERIPARCAFGIPDPQEHMALGNNLSPQLTWTGVPASARSHVLICTDPDVPSVADDVNQEGRIIPADLPRTDFIHWVMVDIPTGDGSIDEGACSDQVTIGGKQTPSGPGRSRQGINDYTNFLAGDTQMRGDYLGYDGPCPPWNDERLHHYHFVLYATDLERCPVNGKFTAAEVLAAIDGHILAEARLVGTYSLHPDVS